MRMEMGMGIEMEMGILERRMLFLRDFSVPGSLHAAWESGGVQWV